MDQLLESIRRASFLEVVRTRAISDRRADPDSDLFDPLRAAVLASEAGELDEAYWLVFLAVHFGKHRRAGWAYAREVYKGEGEDLRWNWMNISASPDHFRTWLEEQEPRIRPLGRFGNHRKHESLSARDPKGTGAVVASYVEWVKPPRGHGELVNDAWRAGTARAAFDELFQSLESVTRFGRLAKFDYLTNVGRVGLSPIVPGSPYMEGATGPRNGAQLLFESPDSVEDLDNKLIRLDSELRVGLDVVEDALCNWSKSPDSFRAFRGS